MARSATPPFAVRACFIVTLELAKRFVLPIIQRWSRKTVWLVKWSVDDAITECRWFRSEERARAYGEMVMGAIITKETYTGDDHPQLSDGHLPGYLNLIEI